MQTCCQTLSLAGLSALLADAGPTSLQGPLAASTASRPQMAAEEAARHTAAAYFAKGGTIEALIDDPWDPIGAGIGDVAGLKPNYIVAADGSGTHRTIQAAFDALTAKGGADRVYVLVKPGTYREQLCLTDAPPVTLYGLDADASRVLIVEGKANGTAKARDAILNACEGRQGMDTYGTFASATVLAYADGFQAKNLTIANDYDEGPTPKPGPQAVALSTQGDKVILENVRLLSHQDTLALRSRDRATINRVYVTNSYIEGDVDFIFGHAIAVFEQVEFKSLTDRPGSEGGFVFAPSHPQLYPIGFLATACTFTCDDNAAGKTINLGRAWDESTGSYTATDGTVHVPNGTLLIRNSWIGGHIDTAAPWNRAATTARPFRSDGPQTLLFGTLRADTVFPANRLYEFRNTGPGAAR